LIYYIYYFGKPKNKHFKIQEFLNCPSGLRKMNFAGSTWLVLSAQALGGIASGVS